MIRIIIRRRESGASLTHSCQRGVVMRWVGMKGQVVQLGLTLLKMTPFCGGTKDKKLTQERGRSHFRSFSGLLPSYLSPDQITHITFKLISHLPAIKTPSGPKQDLPSPPRTESISCGQNRIVLKDQILEVSTPVFKSQFGHLL